MRRRVRRPMHRPMLTLAMLVMSLAAGLAALTGCQTSRDPMPTVKPSYSYVDDEQRAETDRNNHSQFVPSVARVQSTDDQ